MDEETFEWFHQPWQYGTTFVDLEDGVYYYVIAYAEGDDLWYDGVEEMSEGLQVAPPALIDPDHESNDVTVTFAGETFDLEDVEDEVTGEKLFVLEGAGDRTFVITGGTGDGTISDGVLTVTKAGTFEITVTTDASTTHKPGIADATLTVNKGEGAVLTWPDPVMDSHTTTSITINEVVAPNGQTVRYCIGWHDENDQTKPWHSPGWTFDTTFTNLIHGRDYWVLAQAVEDDLWNEGDFIVSEALHVEDPGLPAPEHEENDITVTYADETFDLNDLADRLDSSKKLFVFDGDGERYDWEITGGTGEGMIDSYGVLTVTKVGTFEISVKTAAGTTHLAGDAEATLTVLHGEGLDVDKPVRRNRFTGPVVITIEPPTAPSSSGDVTLVDSRYVLAKTGQHIEFAINTSPNSKAEALEWQDTLSFNALLGSPLETDGIYYVYARSSETDLWGAGTPQVSSVILPVGWRELTTDDFIALDGGVLNINRIGAGNHTVWIPGDLVVANATITVGSGASLVVDGAVHILDGSQLINNGTVSVRNGGELTNEGTINNNANIRIDGLLTNEEGGTINNFGGIVINGGNGELNNNRGFILNEVGAGIEIKDGKLINAWVDEDEANWQIQNNGFIRIMTGGFLENLGFIMNREWHSSHQTQGEITNNGGDIVGEDRILGNNEVLGPAGVGPNGAAIIIDDGGSREGITVHGSSAAFLDEEEIAEAEARTEAKTEAKTEGKAEVEVEVEIEVETETEAGTESEDE
jgi:hypothetical protein